MNKALLHGITLTTAIVTGFFLLTMSGCDNKAGTPTIAPTEPTSGEKPRTESAAPKKQSVSDFSAGDAAANLSFAKNQYLKMLAHVDNNKHLHYAEGCSKPEAVCFPRALENGEIYMEQLKRWTNGFWPGVLWKLLAADRFIDDFDDKEKTKMLASASFYTDALLSEAHRTSTHDLGFLLYDSFGEALEYKELESGKRKIYEQALKDGRNSLATRYSADKGLIKSWDWTPGIIVSRKTEEGMATTRQPLNSPWTYPVIVDNMMNLEFLLTSDDEQHHKIAYSHAAKTKQHHFHYLADDPKKERPVAYHVFDYGTMRPGNWQGMGNISAWARGQGWSFYGFVSVAEFAKTSGVTLEGMPDFKAFTETLFGSIDHLLKDDPVPLWDFLANEENAPARAENMSDETAVYSHILTLCPHMIPRDTLPYVGYRPIMIDISLPAKETVELFKSFTSISGEPMIIDDKVVPCGTQAYDLSGRVIPKDTSAAALIAAGLYRFAQFTDETDKKNDYIALADRIMAEITQNYRTDKAKGKAYELGFLMTEATGNLPSASEINTPIVYADFYFIEANIRKLQLAEQK